MNMINIPQCNPKSNYLSYKAEVDAAVSSVLSSGRYILGENVELFEKEFADYLGVGHAVSVASGTDAVELSLRALGIGRGDYVVTVSHTAVATVAAIERAGALPLFVDIDPVTFNMDPNSLEALFDKTNDKKIKAVIPVHLYGCPADIPVIARIAAKRNVKIIEDCAQAHGAMIGNSKVGTYGQTGAFSFYPTKNMGAVGDGGMIVAKDPEIAHSLRLLRQYGWEQRYVSSISGVNSRLDEMQAAILRVKLRHLDEDNDKRRRIAGIYDEKLYKTSVIIPGVPRGMTHVYHQYVIRHQRRDQFMQHLAGEDIGTLIHYPVPVHLQPAYSGVPRIVSLEHTEKVVQEIASLPMYPELSEDDVRTVVDTIRRIPST